MKIKIILSLCLFIIFLPIVVFAQTPFIYPAPDGIITSPFGDRVHPITGNTRFHAGIDIGYDYGTPIQSAADGIIRYYGPADGFGNAIVVWHPKLNMGTLYGDVGLIQGLHEGQEVYQGDVIGIISPVGDSTGGHLHFEVHLNDIDFHVNGAIVTDPLPLLEGTMPVEESFIGSDAHFFNFDWSKIADIALPVKDIIDKIATTSTEGIQNIKPYMLNLFMVVVLIDITLTFCIISISDNYVLNDAIKVLIKKLISYTFFYYLIQNWGNIVINTIKNFFVTVGSKIINVDPTVAGQNVTDPTQIIQKGLQLTAPFFNYISTFHSAFAIYTNLAAIIFVFILGIAIVMAWYIVFASLISVQLTAFNFGDMMTTSNRGAVNLENAGVEAITIFMSAIKDKESTNDYFVYSDDGYGYGAYQINFENWNAWVAEANLPPDYSWTPHTNTMQPAWSPDRQDAVARFKMLQYYQQYGNWRAVAEAWHGGEGNIGSGDAYADDVFRRAGQVAPAPTFDVIKALEIFAYILIMTFVGGKVSKAIKNMFGSSGFRF